MAKLRTKVETHTKSTEDENTMRCVSRLKQLSKLPANWYDDGSSSPSSAAVRAARSLLILVPNLPPVVSIFPTYSGGVLFEYKRNGWDWSVEFLANGFVEVHGLELDDDGEFEVQSFENTTEALDTIQRTVP